MTDDDIRQYLRGHWHLEHPTDLQKKENTVRNEILIEAIQYGAPLRQLSESEEIFKIGMCLPAGPYVSDEDVRYIVNCIKEAII